MKTQEMKTSVLHANEKVAKKLFADFEKMNKSLTNGRMFIRKEVSENKETGEKYLKGSFIIRYVRVEDPKMGVTIFRFIKRKIGNKIEWDERFCTI